MRLYFIIGNPKHFFCSYINTSIPKNVLTMKKTLLFVFTLFLSQTMNAQLQTAFEKSGGAETGTYYEVIDYYKALADELLFGRLLNGGTVLVDVADSGEVVLTIQAAVTKGKAASTETSEET